MLEIAITRFGAAMKQRLTKTVVDSLVSSKRDFFVWDDRVAGFGIKVSPAGRKIFVLQYRSDGRVKRERIGLFGDLTVDEARQEAIARRGRIAERSHVVTRRSVAPVTMAELSDRYLREHAAPFKKPSGLAQDRRNIENHVKPTIGKILVADLTRTDVERAMQQIAGGLTSRDERTRKQGRRIVQGGPVVANRCHALLHKMLDLAGRWELRPSGANPAAGAKRFKENRVERFLSVEELARLGAALDSVPIKGQISKGRTRGHSSAAVAAVRFLLLTGCRVGEALSLRWDQIDINQGIARLSDSKTGARVLHVAAAVDLLKEIPKLPDNPWVFMGSKPKSRLGSIRKVWEYLCKKAELEAFRIHDLRHNFASVAVSNGISLPIIGKILGHSNTNTTQRHAHLANDPVVAAHRSTADAIQKAIKPAKPEGFDPPIE